jgi:hypothetical protein
MNTVAEIAPGNANLPLASRIYLASRSKFKDCRGICANEAHRCGLDIQIVRFTFVWHKKCKKPIKSEGKSLVLFGGPMRSDLVFGASKQVSNCFFLARALAVATRKFHKPGTRVQDTINEVLARFGGASQVAGTVARR